MFFRCTPRLPHNLFNKLGQEFVGIPQGLNSMCQGNEEVICLDVGQAIHLVRGARSLFPVAAAIPAWDWNVSRLGEDSAGLLKLFRESLICEIKDGGGGNLLGFFELGDERVWGYVQELMVYDGPLRFFIGCGDVSAVVRSLSEGALCDAAALYNSFDVVLPELEKLRDAYGWMLLMHFEGEDESLLLLGHQECGCPMGATLRSSLIFRPR